MPLLARPRADTWLARFGAPTPVCAVRLRQAVLHASEARPLHELGALREPAESLGVLLPEGEGGPYGGSP